MNIIGAQHPDGTFADGVIGNHGKERRIDTQVCQCQGQGNICFTAAVSSLKFILNIKACCYVLFSARKVPKEGDLRGAESRAPARQRR